MIGLDAVDIERFEHWSNYSIKQLERVFHPEEISYAFSNPQKTAERLAARFAAKEAFYKAFCSVTCAQYSFFFILKNVSVKYKENGAPILIVNSNIIDFKYSCHITITHTDKTAIALVMLN